jgi:hypothetical protein
MRLSDTTYSICSAINSTSTFTLRLENLILVNELLKHRNFLHPMANLPLNRYYNPFISSHPIDVVKTRLQVSGDGTNGARNYKALGIRGTVSIIATEVTTEPA